MRIRKQGRMRESPPRSRSCKSKSSPSHARDLVQVRARVHAFRHLPSSLCPSLSSFTRTHGLHTPPSQHPKLRLGSELIMRRERRAKGRQLLTTCSTVLFVSVDAMLDRTVRHFCPQPCVCMRTCMPRLTRWIATVGLGAAFQQATSRSAWSECARHVHADADTGRNTGGNTPLRSKQTGIAGEIE